MRSPDPSVLAVQLWGMACCKARTTGIEWHMSVSSMKDWRCKNHQFGGNRYFRKYQLEPSAARICHLGLNQAGKTTAENLANSCVLCNQCKGSDLASID